MKDADLNAFLTLIALQTKLAYEASAQTLAPEHADKMLNVRRSTTCPPAPALADTQAIHLDFVIYPLKNVRLIRIYSFQ